MLTTIHTQEKLNHTKEKRTPGSIQATDKEGKSIIFITQHLTIKSVNEIEAAFNDQMN